MTMVDEVREAMSHCRFEMCCRVPQYIVTRSGRREGVYEFHVWSINTRADPSLTAVHAIKGRGGFDQNNLGVPA